MKELFRAGLVLVTLALVPTTLMAGESPVKGGGNVGIGLEVGDPGVWGAVGKIWIDKQNAFQPAIKLGYGTALLQLSYLWHDFDIIHPKQGLMPLYFGAGGGLSVQNIVAAEGHGAVGISYLFNRTDVPVDIYIQMEPTLSFASGASAFSIYGNIGSRYYF
jgi:hypothetical protein